MASMMPAREVAAQDRVGQGLQDHSVESIWDCSNETNPNELAEEDRTSRAFWESQKQLRPAY
jgi:hypothetical protein